MPKDHQGETVRQYCRPRRMQEEKHQGIRGSLIPPMDGRQMLELHSDKLKFKKDA